MNKRQHTYWAGFVIIIALIAISGIKCGCSTTEKVNDIDNPDDNDEIIEGDVVSDWGEFPQNTVYYEVQVPVPLVPLVKYKHLIFLFDGEMRIDDVNAILDALISSGEISWYDPRYDMTLSGSSRYRHQYKGMRYIDTFESIHNSYEYVVFYQGSIIVGEYDDMSDFISGRSWVFDVSAYQLIY